MLLLTNFNGNDIKVEMANFCAVIDTLVDQDALQSAVVLLLFSVA